MGTEIIIVRAIQTCTAAPSQWDAWDLDGRYWYLRFRHGYGTMGRDYLEDRLSFEVNYEETGLDGSISLAEFCERAGVTYRPDLFDPQLALERPP